MGNSSGAATGGAMGQLPVQVSKTVAPGGNFSKSPISGLPGGNFKNTPKRKKSDQLRKIAKND